jgi:8-oxo-dGTP pyrophosphatase MutT (NUDIX family)
VAVAADTHEASALLQARDPARLREFIETRLRNTAPSMDPQRANTPGLTPEQVAHFRSLMPATTVPAAVLVPIVERPDELTLLLTERASHLKRHAGQISFPGGKMESFDAGPKEAALRESEEEIGLRREFVTVAGYLESQLILTGFCVVPVVGFVKPGFELQLDSTEVAGAFEVPLRHILDSTNHQLREREAGGMNIPVNNIPFGERDIWGATASMLLTFYRLLMGPSAASGQ